MYNCGCGVPEMREKEGSLGFELSNEKMKSILTHVGKSEGGAAVYYMNGVYVCICECVYQ